MRNHYKLYLSVHRVPLIRIITISGLTAYSGGQYTQRKINEAKQTKMKSLYIKVITDLNNLHLCSSPPPKQ